MQEMDLGGITDPLLQWFMEENCAKEEIIVDLQHDLRVQRAENEQLYDWFVQAQERFATMNALLRGCRNRCFELERRLIRHEGHFEVINMVTPSSPESNLSEYVPETDLSDIETHMSDEEL
jgi:hypothetical protein